MVPAMITTTMKQQQQHHHHHHQKQRHTIMVWTALLLLLNSSTTTAFVPHAKSSQRSILPPSNNIYFVPSTNGGNAAVSTSLRATSGNRSGGPLTEDQARYILNKARECAFQDGRLFDDLIEHGGPTSTDREGELAAAASTTVTGNNHFTIDEAQYFLREMIHIQSSCVTGQVVGHDLCDDQDAAAEIVANLRNKIDEYERRLAKRQKGSDSVVPWIATELSVGALLLVVVVFWTTLDMTATMNGDVEDMVASSTAASSSLQLNNFQDWLGIFQEHYLGAKDSIVSSV